MLCTRMLRTPAIALAALPAVAVAVCVACSPTDPAQAGDDGGDGDGQAAISPEGFVAATVGSGAQSPDCPIGSPMPWLSIGSATSGTPAIVESSSSATIDCAVRAVGKGYDVSVSVVVQGPGGGSFTLDSPQGLGAVRVSGAQGLAASFASTQAGATYQESDCTLSFTYLGQPVPDSPSVFPSRIWAHVSCPTAQPQGASDASDTCDGEADFLFERCAE